MEILKGKQLVIKLFEILEVRIFILDFLNKNKIFNLKQKTNSKKNHLTLFL